MQRAGLIVIVLIMLCSVPGLLSLLCFGCAACRACCHCCDCAVQRAGLDTEKLMLCQPDSGEMALEVVDQTVRSNAVDIICVDSVAALVPRAEIEGEMGAHQGGKYHLLLVEWLCPAGMTVIQLCGLLLLL